MDDININRTRCIRARVFVKFFLRKYVTKVRLESWPNKLATLAWKNEITFERTGRTKYVKGRGIKKQFVSPFFSIVQHFVRGTFRVEFNPNNPRFTFDFTHPAIIESLFSSRTRSWRTLARYVPVNYPIHRGIRAWQICVIREFPT